MKYYFILLIVFTCLATYAQLVGTDVEVGAGKCMPYAIANNNKLTCFLMDKRTVHMFVYDSLIKLNKTQDFNLKSVVENSNEPIEVAAINDSPTLFFANKSFSEFSYAAFNTNDYTMDLALLPKPEKDEKYVGCFSANNRFYMLYLKVKKDFSLVIEEISFPLQISKHAIGLSDLKMCNNKGTGIKGYFFYLDPISSQEQGIQLQKIRPGGRVTNYTAQSQSKFYYNDQALTLTFNSSNDTTQILTIDLKYFNRTYRQIVAGSRACDGDPDMSDNSFILDHKIFYTAACKQHLLFKIYDELSGNLLKEYATEKSEPISYVNSGYCHITRDPKKPPVVNAKATTINILNNFTGKTDGFTLGLGGFINDDSLLELTLGTSTDAGGGNGFFNPFMPNLFITPGVAMPMRFVGGFHLLLPALIWNESLNNGGLGKGNYFFRVYLNRNTLQPILNTQKTTNLEKLDKEVDRITNEGKADAVGSIMFRGKFLTYYYVREYEQFLLTVFDPEKK